MVDEGLADATGFRSNGFLSLLLGTDEKNRAAACDRFLDEVVGIVDVRERLLQVDDVNAASLGQNEALYLGVPALRLVSEVNTAVEQLANCDDGHGRSPCCLWLMSTTVVVCPGVLAFSTPQGPSDCAVCEHANSPV